MGTTYWSDDDYRERAQRQRRMGRGAFEYHDDLARLPQSERHVHEKMNPYGVAVRESRDSAAHPESNAVAVLFDVTGSMGRVPRILQENLCGLMDMLTAKNYLAHPQILIGGIGDATCDRAPLQIGQFESGIEIDEDLAKLWLEGGGGGQMTESYELALHFMARHTSIDCLEKRGRRGYLFLIGDEMPYACVKRREVTAILGDHVEANLPVEQVLRELEEKYNVYFIIPNLSSYYHDPAIFHCWSELLGERVIRLENPHAISELIAAVIGLAEGAADMDGIAANLMQTGRGDVANVVCNALATMGRQGVPVGWASSPSAVKNKTGWKPILRHSDPTAATHKPRWDFGFTYNSKRWQFVMRIVRALSRTPR